MDQKKVFRPTCFKCKSYKDVDQEDVIVSLEIDTVWVCNSCDLILFKVPEKDKI